jgi:hypothetical protein
MSSPSASLYTISKSDFKTASERRLHHARVPGVRYDIASRVRYPGYTDVSMQVDLALIKSESGSGSTLHAEYCMATSDKYPNPQFHNQAFWKKVASDFRGLVR